MGEETRRQERRIDAEKRAVSSLLFRIIRSHSTPVANSTASDEATAAAAAGQQNFASRKRRETKKREKSSSSCVSHCFLVMGHGKAFVF
ncbi:uncharacterized protein CELE_F55C7.2 [Caenorhabditis elegans]|uniref:Uncharacterized protein n=1 Tax=Caenorhabditis elegans TaxID=6239 RepID=P91335_CAEEL|nr:Uncharacterized protein CELE_F55C7.2 [Caenorhabditis elegans]CCD63875.1 Uncharacterized protein CELE_F55C7.2 [Caenorhabditis elegans]|eukprot:NP_491288.1 Uncharacterized protein CELE_F55C7.2 [Caenorhabditis elegans]